MRAAVRPNKILRSFWSIISDYSLQRYPPRDVVHLYSTEHKRKTSSEFKVSNLIQPKNHLQGWDPYSLVGSVFIFDYEKVDL